MVCGNSSGECPVCRLREALAIALADERSAAAFEIVELLLDAVEAVRYCYAGGSAKAVAEAADALASLAADLEVVAGLGCDQEGDE